MAAITDEPLPLPQTPDDVARGAALLSAMQTTLAAGALLVSPAEPDGLTLLGVCRGEITWTANEFSHTLPAGAAVVLPPEDSASAVCVRDSVVLRAVLVGREPERLLAGALQSPALLYPHGGDAMQRQLLPLFAAVENGATLSWRETASACFALALALYGTESEMIEEAYPPIVRDAIAILREEFAFIYGVEDVADHLHVTKEHLIRQFTAAVGLSPGKYLTAVRIEYAKQCLRGGETSLEAVAAASGFSGAGYFGRVFRQQTGMTPLEYARTAPHEAEHTLQQEIYL